MFTPVSARAASAYKQVSTESRVDTATPHGLIQILFDELLVTLASARGAMARGDVATKGRSIGRAIRILEEGLKAGLDTERGGALAENLRSLYDYCGVRLTIANARNDDAALQEVIGLIEPIAQGWKQIEGASNA